MNKNATTTKMINATANDFIDMLDALAKQARYETDSNANKRATAYNRMASLLLNLHGTTMLQAETTPQGRLNLGTLGECLIKALADNEQTGVYTKSPCGQADIKIGNKTYEIKTGISCYSIPTACKPFGNTYKAVILLNQNGVWLINSKDVADNLDKDGRLSYKGEYGKHYQKFEKMLGMC